ncbi:acetyl-CoA carboxylase biotin carboxyl carrier protein [Blastomonas sp.]|uniref:acetyl-CoA carboxylase biotin carboxyl carrier protein n=1 Tax=Blastomonas sp. TaxID=1909299 RepID=UPI00391B4748
MTGPSLSGQSDEAIAALMEDFQRSGLRELHVRLNDMEIYLSNDSAAAGLDGVMVESSIRPGTAPGAPPAKQSPAAAAKPTAASVPAELPANATIISAPYLGTFYRSPKPGSAAYVEIGSKVSPETELCLVEVMKLFTSVQAECTGTVHSVLANDGDIVQADQPLFVIVTD